MEAKGTVMKTEKRMEFSIKRKWGQVLDVDKLLEAQAEISFKAGRKEERDSWLLKTDIEKTRDAFTKDIIERTRVQAIKEVVEWMRKNSLRNKTIKWWLCILEKDWQTKLKDWFKDQPELLKKWGIE